MSDTQVASAIAPLRRGRFRALWIAGLVSSFGAMMHEVAEGWLMTSISRSPRDVAMLQAVDGVAMLLLAIPAGALADIVDRRRLALATQIWMCACALVLALATQFDAMRPSLLLTLAFAMGLGAAFDEPIWQAITSASVPRRQLPAAIALGGVSFNLARAGGPALGGLVVAVVGPAAAFAVNAATFLWVAMVLARGGRKPRRSTLPAEHWISGIIAGFRYVRHTPALVSALVRCLCVVLPGACLSALLPSYARTELHVSATGFGLLLGAAGVGALVAAAVLERLRSKLSADNLLSLAACASATALASLSLVRSSLGAAGAMVLSGAAWMVMLSTLNIAVQTAAAPWVRTRVLAIYLVVFQAALAAGSIVWGEVAARAGARIALLAGAIALVGLLAARVRFGIESTQADFTPSLHWPMPRLLCAPRSDDGPVRILVEYRVPRANATHFLRALRALERHRRREGALEWAFYRDPENPTRWVETYVNDDWGAHLRQHSRVTAEARHFEDHLRSLIEPGTSPAVSHLISVEADATGRVAFV